MDSNNPYRDASQVASFQDQAVQHGGGKFPTYCTVIFIMDLVFSGLRGLFAALGVLAVVGGVLPEGHPMQATAIYEVISGFGMCVFGFIGSGLILAKQKIGVPFAWLKLLFIFGSIGVSLFQLKATADQYDVGSAEQFGAYIGGGISVVVRLVLVVLFVVAIIKAQSWFKSRS